MFAQVDDDGNRHVLFDLIFDNGTDDTELKQEVMVGSDNAKPLRDGKY